MTIPGGDWLGYWMAWFLVGYVVAGNLMLLALHLRGWLASKGWAAHPDSRSGGVRETGPRSFCVSGARDHAESPSPSGQTDAKPLIGKRRNCMGGI